MLRQNDAFGVLTHSTASSPNTTLFAGEQYDPDLGLYFNRGRYLNVSTGRFWTTDNYEGLTWALEVGDVQRFSSTNKAISYCGLSGAERSFSSEAMAVCVSAPRSEFPFR